MSEKNQINNILYPHITSIYRDMWSNSCTGNIPVIYYMYILYYLYIYTHGIPESHAAIANITQFYPLVPTHTLPVSGSNKHGVRKHRPGIYVSVIIILWTEKEMFKKM